ncbi:MAG: prolipoprotein diacylglyceryl transferase [Bdellovibrionales bacterium]
MVHWLYYHQLDPFLIHIIGNFGLRWYSLAYIFGIVGAYFLAIYFIRRGRLLIPEVKVIDIVTYGGIGAVLGGRLGYGLFYSPDLFMSFDASFPFWGILKFHQGGMSSHGGILGLIVSLWFYGRFHKISFYTLMDLATLGGSVGLFFGRIANFINGELFGRVIETKAWLGVRFPTELFLWTQRPGEYQEQLISLKQVLPSLKSLSNLSLSIPESVVWADWVQRSIFEPNYKAKVSYLCSLIVDMSNEVHVRSLLEPLLSVRHPSQFYQAFFGGLIPFLILCLIWLKPRKAGLVSLFWVMSYLLGRIFTEFFRMPDADIGYQFLSLTRGQWLSVGILIVITFTYTYFIYKKEPKGFSL